MGMRSFVTPAKAGAYTHIRFNPVKSRGASQPLPARMGPGLRRGDGLGEYHE